MEEQTLVTEQPSKTKFLKKKIFGVPLFIILGLGLVLAITVIYIAFHLSFIKTIHVSDTSQNISITVLGDINSTEINCSGGTCNSGDITLINDDSTSHYCIINTAGSANVFINYTGDVTGGGNSTLSIQTNLNPGQSKTFKIYYFSNINGDYQMETSIDCPVNQIFNIQVSESVGVQGVS